MDSLLAWVLAATVAFIATNIDDIFLLTLFFSQVDGTFRPRHVILGQYLGFGAILVISALGYAGALFIPGAWIGLLGLIPIFIGIRMLLRNAHAIPATGVEADPLARAPARSPDSWRAGLLNSHTYSVAAVTFANGGDNISIYIPLFAGGSLLRMGVMIAVFLVLVGVLCYAGARLAHHATIAAVLDRYGPIVVPLLLIGLGVWIVLENRTLTLLGG